MVSDENKGVDRREQFMRGVITVPLGRYSCT